MGKSGLLKGRILNGRTIGIEGRLVCQLKDMSKLDSRLRGTDDLSTERFRTWAMISI